MSFTRDEHEKQMDDWITQFRDNAAAHGKFDHLRLVELLNEGADNHRSSPAAALVHYERGQALAQQLSEPWWELYFEYWICDAYTYGLHDYRKALDLAVKATVKARKPVYASFPYRFRVYAMLIEVYMNIDPIGHAENIREASAFVSAAVQKENFFHALMIVREAELELANEKFELAHNLIRNVLTQHRYHRDLTFHVQNLLCSLYTNTQQWEAGLEAALLGISMMNEDHDRKLIPVFITWGELFAWKLERKSLTKTLRRRYRQLRKAKLLQPSGALGNATFELCRWQRPVLWRRQMLMSSKRSIEWGVQSGAVHLECTYRLERLKLLKTLPLRRRAYRRELAAAREAAQKLIDPSRYLAKLEALA